MPRDRLPETDDDEYYHADLIGLAAETTAGAPLGRVLAIHNFGAGDIIEIAPPSGSTLMLPFTNAVVPTVDLAGGRVIIELPAEIEGEDQDSSDNAGSPEGDAAASNSARHPRESGDP